jgi:outer membrane protein TolC
VPVEPAAPGPGDKPLPINLPTALRLANARTLDIAVASERIRLAAAELERAHVLWLPTVYLGIDYYRHDGQIQDTAGNVLGASKSNFMAGAGPFAVFALTDAIFSPLAARQTVRARAAQFQAAANDSLLAVAEAYFNVQEARGDLAAAFDLVRRSEAVVKKTEALGKGYATDVDNIRARTELNRRRQVLHSARERWRVASADLVRLLRLDPAALVEPMEPPHLRVTLLGPEHTLDDLIPLGLTNRPELAANQALVQATLQRLRQERIRPLVPSVLLRGASTNPAGTLAGGAFGGGQNGDLGKFSGRGDFDIQVLWEWQNLGFGNHALVNARRAEHQASVLELFRTEDRVAAEISQAYAQVGSAAARILDAEKELEEAVKLANLSYESSSQTRRVGNIEVLVIRPQEVVQSVQALAQAYVDYYTAVADFNRAQFRLYRAVGQPAQALASDGAAPPGPPAGGQCKLHVEPGYTVMGHVRAKDGVPLLGQASQKQVVNVTQRGGMCDVMIDRRPTHLLGAGEIPHPFRSQALPHG